jgi:hypothetical protein
VVRDRLSRADAKAAAEARNQARRWPPPWR